MIPRPRFRNGISVPKARTSRAPSCGASLEDLIAEGKLQPDDLVWKPGMAMWVPVTKVEGLLEDLLPAVALEVRSKGRFALTDRRRVIWAGVGMMIVLGLVTVAVGWFRPRSMGPPNAESMRVRRATEEGAREKGGIGATDPLLDDALDSRSARSA